MNMLNNPVVLKQADYKYSLTMLIVLLVNIFLCGYTLMFFTYSTIAILVNILYLITSIVLIVNINGNKYLTSLFHALNVAQLYLCWSFYTDVDIQLQIQKIVLLLSLLVLNFCKIEYDRQNQLINDYQQALMDMESDSDEEDEDDEKKVILV